MQTTKRLVMALRYDGSAYHGFQVQKHECGTIQYKVEQALSHVAAETIHVVCAGRTDAGVHALEQIIHFDTKANRSYRAWVLGANSHLPPDISALWALELDSSFHARFSALSRRYRYILYNHSIRPSLLRHAVSWYRKPLDVALMRQASTYLLGEHDFSSFRGAQCQAKTARRRVDQLHIALYQHYVVFDIQANAFLLHMVRNMVGSLLAVGTEKYPAHWIADLLKKKDRSQGGITASANGLYLMKIHYPNHYALPHLSLDPFFYRKHDYELV